MHSYNILYKNNENNLVLDLTIVWCYMLYGGEVLIMELNWIVKKTHGSLCICYGVFFLRFFQRSDPASKRHYHHTPEDLHIGR